MIKTILRYFSVLSCGFAGLLGIFSILDKTERKNPQTDAKMIHSDWERVGNDIYQSILKFGQENGLR